MARTLKPSEMAQDELQAAVTRVLRMAGVRLARPTRRRWRRSAATDLIIAAPRDWHPTAYDLRLLADETIFP